MERLFFVAFLAILFPFGCVLILSVALLFLCKAKTRPAATACFLVSAVAVILGLLWWGSSTAFFGSPPPGRVPWLVVGPALVCTVTGLVTAAFTVAAISRRLRAPGPRHAIKRTLGFVLVAILFSAIAVVFGFLVYLERDTWISSYRLSNALRNARSVTFVEFAPTTTGVFVLARKTATPEEIARFRSATSPWFMPFNPHGSLCSQPHHYVDIVRADGTELTFYVCFLCGNFFFDPSENEGGAPDLPPSWGRSLSSFFASIGMAPKTDEEYSAFYQREANGQETNAQR